MEKVEYNCQFSQNEATEGEVIQITETVINRKFLPVPWFKSEITTSRYLKFADSQSIVTDQTRFVPSFFMLKSYSKLQRVWNVTCLKRGIYNIHTIQLVGSDLLGAMSISQKAEVDITLTVLPKPIDYEELNLSPKYFYGEVLVKRLIMPDPFYRMGVREYAHGDTMNKIHWKLSAKEQKLMSYNNEFTSSQNMSLVLNMQSQEYERAEVTHREIMEKAIKLCATIIYSCEKNSIPVKLYSNANNDTGKGNYKNTRNNTESHEFFSAGHTKNLMYTLASLDLYATRAFRYYADEIYGKLNTSDIILVTCFIDEHMIDFVSRKVQDGINVKVICLSYIPERFLNSGHNIICLADEFERGMFGDE